MPALRQHAQKQQKEKTRWLNTPNTYLRVNVADEVQRSMGSPRPKTTVRRRSGGRVPDYLCGLDSFKGGTEQISPDLDYYSCPVGLPVGHLGAAAYAHKTSGHLLAPLHREFGPEEQISPGGGWTLLPTNSTKPRSNWFLLLAPPYRGGFCEVHGYPTLDCTSDINPGGGWDINFYYVVFFPTPLLSLSLSLSPPSYTHMHTIHIHTHPYTSTLNLI